MNSNTKTLSLFTRNGVIFTNKPPSYVMIESHYSSVWFKNPTGLRITLREVREGETCELIPSGSDDAAGSLWKGGTWHSF